jgi:hypothetical protein
MAAIHEIVKMYLIEERKRVRFISPPISVIECCCFSRDPPSRARTVNKNRLFILQGCKVLTGFSLKNHEHSELMECITVLTNISRGGMKNTPKEFGSPDGIAALNKTFRFYLQFGNLKVNHVLMY